MADVPRDLLQENLDRDPGWAKLQAEMNRQIAQGLLVLRVAPDGPWKSLRYEDLWTNVPQMDQRPPEGGR